jgi:IS5 family transposase
MRRFEPLMLKFENPKWINDPELGLIDTVLEENPQLITMLASDITAGQTGSDFGRQDTPSVEQIVRAAIYKEMKHLDYRALEYAQEDSRICEQFVKTNPNRPYSFQVMQKYISRITDENLEKFMIALNRIAIEEGLEDVKELRQDSTVIETNIHYPANNSLVYDRVKESGRLLEHLKEEVNGLSYEEYKAKAKRTYFKINVEKRVKLFKKQLKLFVESINRVSNIVKKSPNTAQRQRRRHILRSLKGCVP